MRGSKDALLIGDAETVAEKVLRLHQDLGGISRLNFQMTIATLPHQTMMRAIEILGTRAAPLIRDKLKTSPRQLPFSSDY